MNIGAKLVDVRNMTTAELKNEGWDLYHRAEDEWKVFVFDDGSVIYPSMDYEGNAPGVFFGYKKVKGKNEHFTF
tara:strand:- start:347 stop:568 length:222 start_codon:yes stop_codon:yes gene_type:complete